MTMYGNDIERFEIAGGDNVICGCIGRLFVRYGTFWLKMCACQTLFSIEKSKRVRLKVRNCSERIMSVL